MGGVVRKQGSGTSMLGFCCLLLLLSSCIAKNEKLQPAINYSYSMGIKDLTHKETAFGLAVLPYGAEYDLEIDTPGDVDVLTFTTAHRQKMFELGKIDSKKRIRITYRPIHDIEQKDLHLAYLEAYDRDEGRHVFGLIVFQNPLNIAKARVSCNGTTADFLGTSGCQSLAGLIQRVEFPSKMVMLSSPQCSVDIDREAVSFEIPLKKGVCQYTFISREEGEKKLHEFVTYGWEKIAL